MYHHSPQRMWRVVFALVLTACTAAPLPESQHNGFVHLPVVHRRTSLVQSRDLNVPLKNDLRSYEVQIGFGTPAQFVALTLDTGSSDIWAYGPGSCSVCEGGIYDPTESSSGTYADDVGNLNAGYFDGSTVNGYYVRDTMQIAGTNVKSAVVGVATAAPDRNYGILGLGLDGLESTQSIYPGFIDDLKSQGIIKTGAYSLYLDNLESSTGSLLLGGVDSSKYQGDLVTLPVVASTDGEARLNIRWNSISITGSGGVTTDYSPSYLPWPAVLDSGYTNMVLGNDLFDDFAQYFGAVKNANGVWKVGCDLGDGFVNFGFGSGDAVVISVPFSELAVTNVLDDTGGCAFGFIPALENNVVSFGDTFLRSAYVVFNFDAMTIGLAQASYDQSCSDCAEAV